MTLQDLRIGNWVQVDDLPPEQVTAKTFALLEEHPWHLGFFRGIPLYPEILDKLGFQVDVWSRLDIGQERFIILGRTASVDGLPPASVDGLPLVVMLETTHSEGFSIQQAAHIQNETETYDDNAFILNKKEYFMMKSIRHLHELQNILWMIKGKELKYTP